MNVEVYDLLKRYARRGSTLTYTEVAPMAGVVLDKDFGWARIGEILGEISRHEVAAGRPMLSAVVVQRGGDQMPGVGFFEEARNLGLYSGTSNMDRLAFYATELNRVFDYWQSHPKRD